MIIAFYGGTKNRDAVCQASLNNPEANVRVRPAPVLLAAVPGDIGLAQGLVTMSGEVLGAALPEVYRTVALGLGHPLLAGPRGLADVDDHLLLLV